MYVHTCVCNIGVYNDLFFDVAVVFLQTFKQEYASLKSALDKSKAETLGMKSEAKVCTYISLFKDSYVYGVDTYVHTVFIQIKQGSYKCLGLNKHRGLAL